MVPIGLFRNSITSRGVVTVSGVLTFIVNDSVSEFMLSASVTVTVMLKLPVPVGVPEITPLDEIEIPDGSPDMEYLYGGHPLGTPTWILLITVFCVASLSEILLTEMTEDTINI